MKVYLVSDGSYSDYRVIAIFSTMASAEKYKAIVDADNDVKEFELDPIDVSTIPDGYHNYVVYMAKNGDTRSVNQDEDILGQCILSRDELLMSAIARNKEHAIKIVNEKRVQLIASGEWEKLKAK